MIKKNRKEGIPILDLAIVVVVLSLVWNFSGEVLYLELMAYLCLILSVGGALFRYLLKFHRKYAIWGRLITQASLGGYIVIYWGFFEYENLQIEGFFFYLFSGLIAGPVVKFLVAKILGPFVFGRGFCGWACPHAAVLDFLPFKIPKEGRVKKYEIFRYVHFFVVLAVLVTLFYGFGVNTGEVGSVAEFWWMVCGVLSYYIAAVVLAYLFEDNRAFCKYGCPVPVIQKLFSRFSVHKIYLDPQVCDDCGICEDVCTMNIKLLSYKNSNERNMSTECITCLHCMVACPLEAIWYSAAIDGKRDERIFYK